jgi:hypothetical protein
MYTNWVCSCKRTVQIQLSSRRGSMCFPPELIKNGSFHLWLKWRCSSIKSKQLVGQPCSFGRSVYQSVHNSIMPSKSKVTSTLEPSTDEKMPSGGAHPPHRKRVLFPFVLWGQKCCNVTAAQIQFWISPSTIIKSYPNTTRIAKNWATLDNLLQKKKWANTSTYYLPRPRLFDETGQESLLPSPRSVIQECYSYCSQTSGRVPFRYMH